MEMKKKKPKKKGGAGKGGVKRPFLLGYIVLAFLIGFVIALLLFRYTGKPTVELTREEPAAVTPEVPALSMDLPGPRVAIVIDDMGHDLKRLRSLLDIDAQITVAVLPHLRFSREVATEAYSRGWEVLLHMPMEPHNLKGNNPGEGALLTVMDEAEVRLKMRESLDGVPYVSGVNNHMGSKFTEDPVLLRAVLGMVKERGLFFLDSRTSPDSVAGKLAREMGVPGVTRNVFLDNTRDEQYIRERLDELVRIARDRGVAVAIGHPYPETIAALKSALYSESFDGVEVVRVSELTE